MLVFLAQRTRDRLAVVGVGAIAVGLLIVELADAGVIEPVRLQL